MIPTEKRGWGAASTKNKPTTVTPRYCVSPQLAPPSVTPKSKEMFLKSEDYHKKD